MIPFILIVDYDEPPVISDPWSTSLPKDLNYRIRIEEGVIHCYKTDEDMDDGRRKHLINCSDFRL